MWIGELKAGYERNDGQYVNPEVRTPRTGLAYAGVLIFLRLLRDASSRWLTALNHLFAALVLVPLVWPRPAPTPAQAVVLFFYGAAQMAVPYWLVARGLRDAVATFECTIMTSL